MRAVPTAAAPVVGGDPDQGGGGGGGGGSDIVWWPLTLANALNTPNSDPATLTDVGGAIRSVFASGVAGERRRLGGTGTDEGLRAAQARWDVSAITGVAEADILAGRVIIEMRATMVGDRQGAALCMFAIGPVSGAPPYSTSRECGALGVRHQALNDDDRAITMHRIGSGSTGMGGLIQAKRWDLTWVPTRAGPNPGELPSYGSLTAQYYQDVAGNVRAAHRTVFYNDEFDANKVVAGWGRYGTGALPENVIDGVPQGNAGVVTWKIELAAHLRPG